jgi:hypothetical protein
VQSDEDRLLPRAVALLALGLALSAAAPAAAQVPPALGPDGRAFTLLGGAEAPREGRPAYRVGGFVGSVAALPGGDVAVALIGPQRPWVVGMDGRMHALPRVPGLSLVAAAADGTLLAATDGQVSRLRADRSGWDLVLDARTSVPGWTGADEIEQLVAFPGGGLAFTSRETRVRRVAPGGAVERVRLPSQTEAKALAALPSGELLVAVENSGGDARLMTAAPGAPLHALTPYREVPALSLAALPDGTILRAGGVLDVLAPDGARLARLGAGLPFGSGDGRPATSAGLGAFGVAAAPDGAVLVTEIVSGGFERLSIGSRLADLLLGFFGGTGSLSMPVRAFVPPGTARPLAAVAPATRRMLPGGRVAVESTLAGDATVVVRRRGREVVSATASVPAGHSVVVVPPPPEGDLTVTVEVRGPRGRIAGARLGVSTQSRLRARDLRGAVRRLGELLEGDESSVAGCRRTGARRAVCRIVDRDGRCAGRAVITQRADGRVVRVRTGRRAC